MKTVGSYEAKTHLPKLLARVKKGERITITRHGVPVAMLVPFSESPPPMSVEDAVKGLIEFGKGRKLRGISIRELIEEGRRY